jgi:hypothetical protein
MSFGARIPLCLKDCGAVKPLIQDDFSTEDEWFLNSNPQDEDMHNAPDVLIDFELLPDDLNLKDPVPPHNDDDDFFGSILVLEQGILEEPHAENEVPPQPRPRIERLTMSYTSKANLTVVDHLNAIYDTKEMLGDGNCGFRCAKS